MRPAPAYRCRIIMCLNTLAAQATLELDDRLIKALASRLAIANNISIDYLLLRSTLRSAPKAIPRH